MSPAEIEVAAARLSAGEAEPGRWASPDERLGEIVVVCIVCKDGADDHRGRGARASCAAGSPPTRCPAASCSSTEDEMPMTGSDTKVRDDALVDIVLQRLADDPDPTTAVPATARPNRRGDR